MSFLVSEISFKSCLYILVSIKEKNCLHQTLKKKLYMNVMFVNKDFQNQVIYLSIKELTVITNDMNVKFVPRALLDQAIYWHTKELTQETDLMNVMFVTRDFPSQAVY